MKKMYIVGAITLLGLSFVSAAETKTVAAKVSPSMMRAIPVGKASTTAPGSQERGQGQMVRSTGDATADAEIKALNTEMEAKIKAIHDEYGAKILAVLQARKVTAGSSTAPRMGDDRRMMGTNTHATGTPEGRPGMGRPQDGDHPMGDDQHATGTPGGVRPAPMPMQQKVGASFGDFFRSLFGGQGANADQGQ
jgi:hypothetical protein